MIAIVSIVAVVAAAVLRVAVASVVVSVLRDRVSEDTGGRGSCHGGAGINRLVRVPVSVVGGRAANGRSRESTAQNKCDDIFHNIVWVWGFIETSSIFIRKNQVSEKLSVKPAAVKNTDS
jgi:hypothetical protein